MSACAGRFVLKRGSVVTKKRPLFVGLAYVLSSLAFSSLIGCGNGLLMAPHARNIAPLIQVSGEPVIESVDGVLVGDERTRVAELAANQARIEEERAQEQEDRMNAIRHFVFQEVVAERVRLVTGWLKFVGQKETENIVRSGWDQIVSGHLVDVDQLVAKVVANEAALPIKDSGNEREAVVEQLRASAALSEVELAMWKQILAQGYEARENGISAKAIEKLAIILTAAVTADQVLVADSILARF
ncbi:MAG: hypothetical protein RBT63_07395 [Bdellovibrionales bacterium]|nr:hypothetical protein [Bdellovibrionales bacterium]